MRSMFEECSSLKKLNLSSFDITNVKDMTNIFYGCSSLKKNSIKINNSSKKLLGELKSNLI
jgi:surface protein